MPVAETIASTGAELIRTDITPQKGTAVIAKPMQTARRHSTPRVKLHRVHANLVKAYPPAGGSKLWWDWLKTALGTNSSAFVDASLHQLQAAARLPGSGISEIAVNAALAMIEAVAPEDEIEGALAIQMARTHRRLGGATVANAVLPLLVQPPAACSGPTRCRSKRWGGCAEVENKSSVLNVSMSTTAAKESLATLNHEPMILCGTSQ
jgi:hypothetical protein